MRGQATRCQEEECLFTLASRCGDKVQTLGDGADGSLLPEQEDFGLEPVSAHGHRELSCRHDGFEVRIPHRSAAE